jgi:hypothetical protein
MQTEVAVTSLSSFVQSGGYFFSGAAAPAALTKG